MHQQIYAGFVMTGPFSFRPYDTLGLNISEFEMTPEEQAYLAEVRKKEGGTGVNALHQTDYDLTYSIHLVKGLELMPSIQYLVHPDNSSLPKTSVAAEEHIRVRHRPARRPRRVDGLQACRGQ